MLQVYLLGLYIFFFSYQASFSYGLELKNTRETLKLFNPVLSKISSFGTGFLSFPIADKTINVSDIFFICSSGGGGHIQAKNAKVAQYLSFSTSKNHNLLQVDVMKDWLGIFGKCSTWLWNSFQQSGNVKWLNQMASMQGFSENMMGNFIYQKMFNFLKQHPNIKRITNTQPLCNSFICKAVFDINQRFSRNIDVEIVMTDLPTPFSNHFWQGLKNLTPSERSVVKLEMMPLQMPNNLSENEIKAETKEFLLKYCGGDLNVVHNFCPPINPSFFAENHQNINQINDRGYLLANINNSNEQQFFDRFCKTNTTHSVAKIPVSKSDKIITVVLGSQGGVALVDYAKTLIKESKTRPLSKNKVKILLFCANSDLSFKKISYLVSKTTTPKNLKIIPLGIQTSLYLAEAFERSDVIVIKSGGLSCFEILAIAEHAKNKKKYLIHSHSNSLIKKDLLAAIPVWEGGNARYMMSMLGAELVNPRNLASKIRSLSLL